MADKTIRVKDSLTNSFVDLRVRDNGDGTYSQDVQGNLLALKNTIDRITSYDAIDGVMNGTTVLVPKTAIANISQSQTDASIVGAVSGKKIVVLQVFCLTGTTATDLVFNSKGSGAGTPITPTMKNKENGGEVLPYSKVGWFETNTNEGLTVTTGAGSTTGILLKYVEVS